MSPAHRVQSDDDLCGHGFNRRQSAIINSTHWTRPRTFTPIGATNIWKPLNDSGYILDSAHFPENRERILDEKCPNLKNPDDIPDKTHSLHYYTAAPAATLVTPVTPAVALLTIALPAIPAITAILGIHTAPAPAAFQNPATRFAINYKPSPLRSDNKLKL